MNAPQTRKEQAKDRQPEPPASSSCPNCGKHLEERKSKLICAACGYFMSCEDYY